MAESALNLAMEKLNRVIDSKLLSGAAGELDGWDLITVDDLRSLYEELGLLRRFLKGWEEKLVHQREDFRTLERRIIDIASEAENVIESMHWGLVGLKTWHLKMFRLHLFMEKLEATKTEMAKTYVKKIPDRSIHWGDSDSSKRDSSRENTATWEGETMVGFENETMILKEWLTGGLKQLEIISIIGMAGLGKTTLARKLYDDPLVVFRFYVRLWVSVSQEYRKRDLLVRLVSSVIKNNPNVIDGMNESELAQLLYKSLKGRVYLVVMDDIWDIRVWDDLRSIFPNDNNGSRIMFTSRHESVALLSKSNRSSLSLRFLSDDESWDLLQQRVFGRETCVPELVELGKQITKKCHGLPLAIVVVAGILANDQKTRDRWKQVAETLNSSTASDPQLWEKTLGLSYNNLPHQLKRCFLYFGVFAEDSQITVQKLVWLWVAEGFVRKTGDQSLEDVASGYLLDLISRSLILVCKRQYDGGVKACGIHDLLRDFCIKQAEKERSLQQISTGWQEFIFPFSFNPEHLCIKDSENAWTATSVFASSDKPVAFFCFNSQCAGSQDPGFHYPCYDLLRVFDIRSCNIFRNISDIVKLVHLSYLELYAPYASPEINVPASISNLQNLETLIIHVGSCVILPQCIRKMVKLRHIGLTAKGGHKLKEQDPDARYPFSLDDLQTLSWVDPYYWEDFIAGTPNLKKLGFWGHIVSRKCLMFPDLYFLNQLQELKLHHTGSVEFGVRLKGIRFPTNLKKLTFERTYLSWDEISTLGKLLPTLEVLKLLQNACKGPVWETSEDFPQLKFLKYKFLDIEQWNASSSHFPRLQKLVLDDCYQLEKIPSGIGEILTLQMIEVHFCIPSLVNSAREIKEEQESMGNSLLQVVIHSWQFSHPTRDSEGLGSE
ncbi:hypothetical protein U1Q18_001955 [Sarracenia purpurea var. burkii]